VEKNTKSLNTKNNENSKVKGIHQTMYTHSKDPSIVVPFALHEPTIVWLKMMQGMAKKSLDARIMVLDSQSSKEMC